MPTKKHVFPGLPHAFCLFDTLDSSKRWDDLMMESLRWLVEGGAPADPKGVWQEEVPEKYRKGA